ncbi:MAG: hypothetical protein Q8L54_07775 [Devosia sp.]|nr:hypothetical protein [Devosia sp.]
MSDLDQREQAQLGLKYIEDSIVGLLTRHPKGMDGSAIADVLGLRPDMKPEQRALVAAGVLELLVRSGRILWNETKRVYEDNPDVS